MAGTFLRSLWSTLVGLITRNDVDGGEGQLIPGEATRFIFSKNHYNKTGPKEQAFLPPEKTGPAYESSICLTAGLDAGGVWDLGRKHVEPARGLPILARADFHSTDVEEVGLSVEHNRKPFFRHANIVAWPENKAKRKLLAQAMARRARLERIPN